MGPARLGVVVLALSGCSFDMAAVRTELGPRAANDLGCKPSAIEFEEVKQPLSPSNVRVAGCGKKNEYTLVQGRWTPVRRALQTP
ncbi:MAG: hypothetical protein Q8S33_04620 [Myxococcales bacterium]|nr:hypothetical protein [Myxococcales bacterium]